MEDKTRHVPVGIGSPHVPWPRADEFKGTGNAYPGGKYFDFLGLSRGSEEQLRDYKIKVRPA